MAVNKQQYYVIAVFNVDLMTLLFFPGLGSRGFQQNHLVLCKEFLILVAFSACVQRLGRGEAALPGSELISAANYLCPNLLGLCYCASEGRPGQPKHLHLILFSSHLWKKHNKHLNSTISILRWPWPCCLRDELLICRLVYVFVALIVHLVHIFFGRFFCYNYMIA